eukprot:5000941-Lingulodinium_polyedra.AAC.1
MGRAFWEMAEADARPAAALYLDLVAAFAPVARDLLCIAGRADLEAGRFMRRFGIEGSLEAEVSKVLEGPVVLSRIGVGRHLRALVEANLRES